MGTVQRGTTVVELAVAMAILVVVFSAIMPVFATIRNHADAAGANSEMVQNARVLNEQLCRCLAQARRIRAMSANTETVGYIEFETNDGALQRCQLGSSGYVEFGPSGDLCDLAGPAECLTFVCYDGNDPAIQTDVPEHVRLVAWEARLKSAGTLTRDKTIRGTCYLRVNGNVNTEEVPVTYDLRTGRQGVDSFAFAGEGGTQAPTAPDTPSNALSPGQYDAIEVQDGTFHEINVSTAADYAQIRLVFQIEQSRSEVSRITATWTGKGVNGQPGRMNGASLYVWNYASAGYELLQTSPDTDGEITVTGSCNDMPARYIGGPEGKRVVLLVASNDTKASQTANTLFTDYVRLDIAARPTTGLLP